MKRLTKEHWAKELDAHIMVRFLTPVKTEYSILAETYVTRSLDGTPLSNAILNFTAGYMARVEVEV